MPEKSHHHEKRPGELFYPEIDHDLCVGCGLCEQVCPIGFDDFVRPDQTKAFVGVNKDRKIVFQSSSGGAFLALCDIFLSKGYTIYGVRFDEDLKVVYGSADTMEGCLKFSKSKYVLSDTNGCFEEIADKVKRGRDILFSGTPCHCAALRRYLGAKRIPVDHVFLVDILCHGGPSQDIFDSYIRETEAIGYQFRYKEEDKNKGIDSRNACVRTRDGRTVIRNSDNDVFLRGYYKRLFYLRPRGPAELFCPGRHGAGCAGSRP